MFMFDLHETFKNNRPTDYQSMNIAWKDVGKKMSHFESTIPVEDG